MGSEGDISEMEETGSKMKMRWKSLVENLCQFHQPSVFTGGECRCMVAILHIIKFWLIYDIDQIGEKNEEL